MLYEFIKIKGRFFLLLNKICADNDNFNFELSKVDFQTF